MKLKVGILLCILILLVSCTPSEEAPSEEINEEESLEEHVSTTEKSKCDSMTDPSRKIRCQAWEAKDISMCADIPLKNFKEDCVVGAAELVEDTSQLASCAIAESSVTQIMCNALVNRNVDTCFTMATSLSGNTDLAIRDCIELVARKTKDKEICQYFSTHSKNLIEACGSSDSDCDGLWNFGMAENIQNCETVVEEASSLP